MFRLPTRPLAAGGLIAVTSALVPPVAAHVGSLEGASADAPIPEWYVVSVAGVVVGASFLFTSLMADHEALRWVNGLSVGGRVSGAVRSLLTSLVGVLGILALVGLVALGFVGPSRANYNLASLGVWVGWWGGFTIVTYAVGNAWPVIDPVRRLARLVPARPRWRYPDWLGAWPAVAGLLVLVFFEVVTGSTERPRVLAGLIVLYTVLTVVAAVAFGVREWFEHADPLAAIFRVYGAMAPVQRTETGLSVRLPGAALTDGVVYRTPGSVAFVIALLWATTFDGLVSTPLWRSVLTPWVTLGLPALLGYVVVLLGGFLLFYAIYRAAARWSRSSADTYVAAPEIARWLAPSLVPIAAGYHFAHFVGYVITLSPALLGALADPLTGPSAFEIALLPDWFGFVQLGAVLLGHLLAIWVAHSIAFELFPGVRQPIRSQYPLIAVMIAYTLVSAWVIVAPTIQTPYV